MAIPAKTRTSMFRGRPGWESLSPCCPRKYKTTEEWKINVCMCISPAGNGAGVVDLLIDAGTKGPLINLWFSGSSPDTPSIHI